MLDGFDFLTAEFFSAVLREQKSVIIHPYVAPEKLNLFLTVLPCHSIIEIDVSDMDMEETFEWMIHSYSAEPKDTQGLAKPLLFLTNLTASQAKRLSREEDMHFIAIVKEPVKEDDIGSSRVLVYNRKLGSFVNYSPKFLESDSFEHLVVQKLKETQNHIPAKKIITETIQKAKKIYEFLILDDFDSLYPEIQKLTIIEKDFIKDFLGQYFRISVDSDLFNSTGPDTQPPKINRPLKENQSKKQKGIATSALKEEASKEESNSTPANTTKNSATQFKVGKQNQPIESNRDLNLKKPTELHPLTRSIKSMNGGGAKIADIAAGSKEIRNRPEPLRKERLEKEPKNLNGRSEFEGTSKGSINDRYMKELRAIRASKLGFGAIFDYCLESMRFLDGFKELKDPETLYHCLRDSKWKSGIPSQFLLELYRTKINSALKSFPTLNSEDYVLMLEETKKELLGAIKNVPKAQDFEIELEEYIQRILKQREFHEIREEMKENIQHIKSTYSDHLNQKYKQNQIEIIPVDANTPKNNSKTSKVSCKGAENVSELKPTMNSEPNSNPGHTMPDPQILHAVEQKSKISATLGHPNQYSETFAPISEHLQRKNAKEIVKDTKRVSRSFSESIIKLNGVMDRLELCLKYIVQNKNKEEIVQ